MEDLTKKRELWIKRINDLEKEISELKGERSRINSRLTYKRKKLSFLYDSNPDQLEIFRLEV